MNDGDVKKFVAVGGPAEFYEWENTLAKEEALALGREIIKWFEENKEAKYILDYTVQNHIKVGKLNQLCQQYQEFYELMEFVEEICEHRQLKFGEVQKSPLFTIFTMNNQFRGKYQSQPKNATVNILATKEHLEAARAAWSKRIKDDKAMRTIGAAPPALRGSSSEDGTAEITIPQ